MSDETESLHEDELSAVIASYLEAVDEGHAPDPSVLLTRHPHLADDLRAFLAAEHQLAQVASPLYQAAGGPKADTISAGGDGSAVPGEDSRAGKAFGAYDLLELIGEGGMGVVYRATDTVLNREVAVKVLQERFSVGSATARRFADEAHITAQLQHPAIPPVHDLGTLPDGRPFLAMKLIKGRTLDQLLRERSGPASDRGRFVAAFEQVCQAVAYAHSSGVIHRDLKPSNVMVGGFGEVQVMDWGLAKVLAGGGRDSQDPSPDEDGRAEIRTMRDADSGTQAGSVLGTPAFMAPEQAGGEVDRVDERSDVFGLGAVLCTILTGRPPYVGATTDAVRGMAIRGETADALAELDRCGADPELVGLCKRCLAADREARPRDAGEVAQTVAGLLAAAEERARQAELDRVRADGERARAEAEVREQRKRRRVQRALGATALGLLMTAGLGVPSPRCGSGPRRRRW